MFSTTLYQPFQEPAEVFLYGGGRNLTRKKATHERSKEYRGMKNLRTRERAEMLPQISRRRIFEGWRDDGGGVA